MTELETTVGYTIRQIRKNKGWYAADLADAIPISRGYLSEVEHGHKAPSLGLLSVIVENLGLSMADFLLAIHKNIR